ncbi:TRAP transporter small permease subunit [Brevibacterium antiquum]|uniref:TRAP transporter small permease subunit n=1 Tax=Brevibacterium antiquum TaxID=234835 RepID=UPI0018DF2646|nr:TRAP transporter small permease [Brevibacterium antiquum]
MMSFGLPGALRSTASWLGTIAGVLLLFVGGLTVADVVSRNVRGQSILGVVEISTLLLVAVAFLGLAAAEVNGKHVTVSLVEEHLGQNGRIVLSVMRSIFIVVLAVALLTGMSVVLESAFTRGETTNDVLRLPTWPAKVVLLLSFAFFFVTALWKEFFVFRILRSGHDPFAMEQQAELDRAAKELEATDER